ncbi:hypothetical protein [Mycobacterium tuberculosis]|uniref:hypothetical protein n=1 Tax=Mycobacterium tuberculosis TaxID=1773 RepID=UPI003F4DCEAC
MAASTSTAATSRRSNSRLPTTLNARDQPPAEVSDQRVSGLTGAVHVVQCLGGCENKRHAYFRSISKTPHIRARGVPSVCAVRTVGVDGAKRPPKPIPVQ